MDASVTSHFHPPPPPQKPVTPEDALNFFMKIAKAKQTGSASSKPPTAYERISKMHAKSKPGPIIKDAPSIADFLASSRLTTKELAWLTMGADI